MMSDCLDDSLAVLLAAALLSGDLKKANTWSFAERIGLFDELTAEELVQQGRPAILIDAVHAIAMAASEGWIGGGRAGHRGQISRWRARPTGRTPPRC